MKNLEGKKAKPPKHSKLLTKLKPLAVVMLQSMTGLGMFTLMIF